MKQLTIDGQEVEYVSLVKRGRPFGARQRAVLRQLGFQRELRTVEAGVEVHRDRGRCGLGKKGHLQSRGIGCCAYCHADGLAVMLRLEKRGVVSHVGRGKWRRLSD